MEKSLRIWKLIDKCLQDAAPVILLYVLESKGSSPGRQGFFMAVSLNNKTGEFAMEGSVGGGIMEHKFVEMAKEKLRVENHEQQAGLIKKQVHDKSAAKNQSGMICSGEQTILIYQVQQKEKPAVEQLVSSLENNKNGTLLLSPEGIDFSNEIPSIDHDYYFESEQQWCYREKTGYKCQLSIIGGGHCSLALSRLIRSMDFYIRVYDTRAGCKTFLENDATHEKHLLSEYDELERRIDSGSNHYVVVMTVGYRTDDIAIRALLLKEFAYLGVLGSKRKMETLLAEYRKAGTPKALLQRISTPVGLPIKSQTPEEIAVSIAAQIIQVKNGKGL